MRLRSFVLIGLLCLCAPLAQAVESADVYSYASPSEWKRDTRQSYTAFSTIDQARGGFCVIGAYASGVGSGDAAKDFQTEWRDIVERPLSVPMPERTSERPWEKGWTVRSGSAQVATANSGEYTASLYVHSGPDRVFSIFVNEAHNGCGKAVAAFLRSVRLTATASPEATTAAAKVQVSPEPAQRSAVSTNLGAVRFTVPEGWSLKSPTFLRAAGLREHVELVPQRLDPEEQLVVLLFDAERTGRSAEEDLGKSWNEILSALGAQPEYDAGKTFTPRPLQRYGNDHKLAQGDGRLRLPDGTYAMSLYVLQIEGNVARVAAIARLLPASLAYPPTSALYNPRFIHAIPQIVLDLQLQGRKAAPTPSRPAKPDAIAGLWTGIAMFGGSLKTTYAYFYPNGEAYLASRPPMNGFDTLATGADALLSPSYWGSYTFDGKSGAVSLPNRDNSVFPVTLSGNTLTITTTGTPHKFARLQAVNGRRFQGRYGIELANGESPSIEFTSDGTFSDRGVLNVVDHWIYPYRASNRPGRGSYEVRNYTLLLLYDDGRTLRLPYTGFGDDGRSPSPAELRLGTEGDVLKRK